MAANLQYNGCLKRVRGLFVKTSPAVDGGPFYSAYRAWRSASIGFIARMDMAFRGKPIDWDQLKSDFDQLNSQYSEFADATRDREHWEPPRP